MAQTVDFRTFLNDAKAAVEELGQFEDRQAELKEHSGRLEKTLEQEKKAVASNIETTVKKRRQELEHSYDEELNRIQEKLRQEKSRREKARNQGMKERIAEETAELRDNSRDIVTRMKTLYKSDRIPLICRTNFYYSLYFPRTLGEIMTLLIVFLLFFAVLPLGIYFFAIPERKTVYLALIYLSDILIFGGLYILIGNLTKNRHMSALREVLTYRSQIRSNEKKIRVITSSIRREGDDSVYNLEKYDDEIARKEQELKEIVHKKQDAVSTFENVTKNIITDEIQAGSKDRLEQLEKEAAELHSQLAYTEQVMKDKKIFIADHYESYVGREFMTAEKLEALLKIMESGKAANISEAREIWLAEQDN